MGALAKACIEILLANDWDVLGTHSSDRSLANTSDSKAVAHYETLTGFVQALTNSPFDFLFSLNNSWIIPPEVIELAGTGTINYHDSPLPRYAGVHATSWAIMNGETHHAVTFHEVNAGIDDGDIYRQQVVSVSESDTAFTLNAKCFEVAIKTFASLVLDLGKGISERTPQPTTGRSYFGRYDRPPCGAIIDFRKTTEELNYLIRALDFGTTLNPLGIPKMLVGSCFVAVRSSSVVRTNNDQLHQQPGRLIRQDADSIDVATANATLRLSNFSTLDGCALTVEEVLNLGVMTVGDIFAAVDPHTQHQVFEVGRSAARFEQAWVDKLRLVRTSPSPFQLGPGTSRIVAYTDAVRLEHLALALSEAPGQFGDHQHKPQPTHQPTHLATAAIYLLFQRLSELQSDDHFAIALETSRLEAGSIFAKWVPMSLDPSTNEINIDRTFDALLQLTFKKLSESVRLQTYAHDVFIRHPDLRGLHTPRYNVGITFATRHEIHTDDVELIFNLADIEKPTLSHGGRLERWQVESIDKALASIVKHGITHPGAPLNEFPLLSQTDHTLMVDTWNATAAPLQDVCVHDLISATIAKFPDSPAVRCGLHSYTYSELGQLSDDVATQLRVAGVVRGDVVAVCLNRSSFMVVALIGILKAGAAYVPIDPTYPDDRLHTIVTGSTPLVVLTSADHRMRFADVDKIVCILDAETTTPRSPQKATAFAAPNCTPDDLAYVIYTSGSTGQPKGVEIRHRGLVNHSLAVAANYGLGPSSRLLCSASIGFDVAGEQIYPALFSGAEIVVRPDDLFESFSRFNTFISNEAITAMVLPTAYWHEWVRELSHLRASPPKSLQSLSVGTEKALGSSLQEWIKVSGGQVRFFQGYGPTETTITSTMLVHEGSEIDPNRPLSIGRPLPNTQVYVLDRYLHPVPVGAVGEMYIGGVGLARGYRGQPELTAEKFVPHPFRNNELVYRTGDLGWMEPTGELFFSGRHDFQVKVRGFRVELGEIEQVLRSHHEVDEAIVLLRSDVGSSELIAYVVVAAHHLNTPGETGLVEQLVQTVRQQLPEYMVPKEVVVLRAFPRTSNGKIDRGALRPPNRPSRQTDGAKSECSPVQQELVDIWEEIMPGRAFGIHDDFFYFGGDSLNALRMLSEVERRFSTSIPLSQFVARPTIATLADCLAHGPAATSIVVNIQPSSNGRPPLWLIHPVGGHVVFAHLLREHMHTSQGIYAIQSQGLDGCDEPLATIEAMAAQYLNLIKDVQPEGPYFLAGPSMGGLISYEIARLLELNRDNIALVALLDTWAPGYPLVTSRLTCIGDQVAAVRSQTGLGNKLKQVRSYIKGEEERPRYDGMRQTDIRTNFTDSIELVTRANTIAMNTYIPKTYGGKLLLLRATLTPNWSCLRFDDPQNGWGSLALSGVNVMPITIEHIGLADRPPPEAARILQREIDSSFDSSLATDLCPSAFTAATTESGSSTITL